MTKDQILQALMYYAPTSKWEISADADPENVTYDKLIWNDLFYIKPSEVELQELFDKSVIAYETNSSYKFERRNSYPPVEEQLDMIFHQGLDVWRERIQNIKNSIPKE